MANLTVVDGHSYLYGAFYGVPDRAATRGTKTRVDAVYGFFALLRVIIEAFPKNKLFIVFDSKKWMQHELDTAETDNDKKEVKSIIDQLTIIQKILDKIGIKWVQHATLKNDDIIASFATYWADNDGKVQISSGDFDFVQLISADISLVRNLHGLIAVRDRAFIREKFGIEPSQYIDFQAMVGDENDAIIGVKGIGPKHAAAALQQFKNIDGIYKNISKLPKNIAEKLMENHARVIENRRRIPMDKHVPIANFIRSAIPDVNKKLALKNVNELLAMIGIR